MTAQAIAPHYALLHHRWSSRGRRRPLAPRFGAKNTFTDVVDITCDISDFRAHIFCPKKTQKLPKKHHEAGPPEQSWTTAYGCIVTNRLRKHKTVTVKTGKRLLVPTKNAKGIFGKFEEGYAHGWVEDEPPKFQNAPPRLHMRKAVNQIHISYIKKRYRKNAAHANIFLKGQLFLQKYSCVVLHQRLPLNSASVYI